MTNPKRILEALSQGAPKSAIISAIAEAGIKCIGQEYGEDNWLSENVFMMDAVGMMPPDSEEYDLKTLSKCDIAYLLNGGTINYNTSYTEKSIIRERCENYRSI